MNVLNQALLEAHEAAALIGSGAHLTIAGDETVLAALPRGNWIGGTIPYFMAQEGGRTTREQVFVTKLDTFGLAPTITQYDDRHLPRVCLDAPDNGYSLIIVPAFSRIHHEFARNAPSYEDMYLKPLVGWVSGVHLDDLGSRSPKTVDGRTGEFWEDRAVVLHVPLPDNISVNVNIVNLFTQGSGDLIYFDRDGFSAATCLIDQKPVSFAKYLRAIGHDIRLPLVADYNGASINVSFKAVNAAHATVEFYGPVFSNVAYRLAGSVAGTYQDAFTQASADLPEASFSCNCVLNYLYGELEGQHTGHVVGPMTFGEIAYQLLNQTMVQLTLDMH